jgi:hypothetical protein
LWFLGYCWLSYFKKSKLIVERKIIKNRKKKVI